MSTSQYFFIAMAIIQPIVVIGVIVFIVKKFRHKKEDQAKHESRDWYLNISLSKEDGLSQFFFLLFIMFLGITLLAINRNMGSPISFQTIVLITALTGVVSTYLLRALYVLPFSLIGILLWWLTKAVEWTKDGDIKSVGLLAVTALFSLLYYSIGQLHEQKKRFKRLALAYSVVGLVMLTAILFILSTRPGLGMLEALTKGSSIFGSWQITGSLLLFAIAIGGSSIAAFLSKTSSIYETLAIILFTILFIIIAFLPQQDFVAGRIGSFNFSSSNNHLTSTGLLWAALLNILIFVMLVGVIFIGYRRREVWLINYGALFLFLLIIAKYFDWFFTFLDKSIFFITAGILMLLLGWGMEKGRKRLISTSREQA